MAEGSIQYIDRMHVLIIQSDDTCLSIFLLQQQGSCFEAGESFVARPDTYEACLGANLNALVFQPSLDDDGSAGQAVFALNDWDVDEKAIKVCSKFIVIRVALLKNIPTLNTHVDIILSCMLRWTNTYMCIDILSCFVVPE